MTSIWRQRILAVGAYTLVAVVVAWAHRESLYYLNAWLKYAVLALLPAVLFLGLFLWERAYPHAGNAWKQGLAIGVTVVLALAMVRLVSAALYLPLEVGTTPITDVRRYESVLDKSEDSPFIAHFPRPVPPGATAVRFYYDPGLLQAPTILELGYTATPERIDALRREYARRSTVAFIAGTENDIIEPWNCVAEDTREFADFPADYTLFYLDEQPPTDEKDWNHPASHGVAISTKRCRVVFWSWSG